MRDLLTFSSEFEDGFMSVVTAYRWLDSCI